jgi:hypothetical protein
MPGIRDQGSGIRDQGSVLFRRSWQIGRSSARRGPRHRDGDYSWGSKGSKEHSHQRASRVSIDHGVARAFAAMDARSGAAADGVGAGSTVASAPRSVRGLRSALHLSREPLRDVGRADVCTDRIAPRVCASATGAFRRRVVDDPAAPGGCASSECLEAGRSHRLAQLERTDCGVRTCLLSRDQGSGIRNQFSQGSLIKIRDQFSSAGSCCSLCCEFERILDASCWPRGVSTHTVRGHPRFGLNGS